MTSSENIGNTRPDPIADPTIDPPIDDDLDRPPPLHCARCRYSLEGLPADAPCPECGSYKRRSGRADEASYAATVSLALGVISAAILFLGPLAFASLLLGPVAVGAGVLALIKGRRSFRQDGLPAIVGIVLGGGATLALVAILSFAFFLTTP